MAERWDFMTLSIAINFKWKRESLHEPQAVLVKTNDKIWKTNVSYDQTVCEPLVFHIRVVEDLNGVYFDFFFIFLFILFFYSLAVFIIFSYFCLFIKVISFLLNIEMSPNFT